MPKTEPRFAITVGREARTIMGVEVTAKGVAAARKLALERVKDQPFDVAHAAIRSRVRETPRIVRKTNH
jgi:hypothetical protein